MNTILQEIFTYYEGGQDISSYDNLLSMLREIQDAEGCISVEVRRAISERFSVKSSYLDAIIKRYPSLKAQPSRFEIKVCTDARCSANHSADLLKELETLLHIQKGQATKDGLFSLNTCQCLHNCRKGPNITVNGTLYQGVDKQMLAEILREYHV